MNAYNGLNEYLSDKLDDFGYAVDVGANDGLYLSNSKWLEDRGWDVMCIEPNPALEKAGRQNRKLWRAVACGDFCGHCDFYVAGEYPHASWSGIELREGGPNISPESWAEVKEKAKRITVPVLTLDVILETSGFPNIDVLFIDVEGYELEVLDGLDLERWTPAFIVAEAWNPDSERELREYLSAWDYAFIERFEHDCLFARRA